MNTHLWAFLQSREEPDGIYPVAQVDGEDGLLPLLQEENDHEGEGVGGDAALSLAVDVAQLQEGKGSLGVSHGPPAASATSRRRPYPCPVAEGQHQGNQPGLQLRQSCQVVGGQAGHVVAGGHLTEQAAAGKPTVHKSSYGLFNHRDGRHRCGEGG